MNKIVLYGIGGMAVLGGLLLLSHKTTATGGTSQPVNSTVSGLSPLLGAGASYNKQTQAATPSSTYFNQAGVSSVGSYDPNPGNQQLQALQINSNNTLAAETVLSRFTEQAFNSLPTNSMGGVASLNSSTSLGGIGATPITLSAQINKVLPKVAGPLAPIMVTPVVVQGSTYYQTSTSTTTTNDTTNNIHNQTYY